MTIKGLPPPRRLDYQKTNRRIANENLQPIKFKILKNSIHKCVYISANLKIIQLPNCPQNYAHNLIVNLTCQNCDKQTAIGFYRKLMDKDEDNNQLKQTIHNLLCEKSECDFDNITNITQCLNSFVKAFRENNNIHQMTIDIYDIKNNNTWVGIRPIE